MKETNKVRINGVQIAFTDEGSGEAIIFLHAFPLGKAMWRAQAKTFRATHRVITFDWHGFGESELSSKPLTMERMADDLSELMNQLAVQSATICGLSMGGYAAFAFHKKYQQKVAALILADTKPSADTEEARRGRFEMAETARTKGAEAIAEAMIPKLLGETSQRNSPDLLKQVRQIIAANNPQAIAQALLAMAGRGDSNEQLARIHCPTLILCGSEDKLTSPEEAKQMFQAIAGSRYEVINGAGHLSNLENSQLFNQAVSKFLVQP